MRGELGRWKNITKYLKKIEDLKKEIKILKEDNAKTKRNLMWKVRKLEKDKLLIENEDEIGP